MPLNFPKYDYPPFLSLWTISNRQTWNLASERFKLTTYKEVIKCFKWNSCSVHSLKASRFFICLFFFLQVLLWQNIFRNFSCHPTPWETEPVNIQFCNSSYNNQLRIGRAISRILPGLCSEMLASWYGIMPVSLIAWLESAPFPFQDAFHILTQLAWMLRSGHKEDRVVLGLSSVSVRQERSI